MSLKISEAWVQNKGEVSLRIENNEEWSNPSRPTQVELRLDKAQPSLIYDICKLKKEPTGDGLGVFKGKYPEPNAEPPLEHLSYLPRIVNSDPLSEATVRLVKDWLLCCRGHSNCKEQKSRPLPTRVIDVRTENPKIIESERLEGSYVALSHCWGSVEDTFSTTALNITERMTLGLKLSQLPLNFRDAISFTRRLGYDYLWIDSLCIIQQDLQDWRHEAGRMAGYYESATVTFAIADAVNCHVGFLSSRRHHYSPPIPGEDGEHYVLRQSLPGDDDLDLNSCIGKRAWTLQERLLSPRVIHFTQGQVVWHCRKHRWAEGYIQNYRSDYVWWDSWSYQMGQCIYQIERAAVDPTHYIAISERAEAWYGCVSEFSARRLTRASDKLAAIAGLADALSRSNLGQYMAGLWEYDLFRGLAWNRLAPVEYEPPLEYRAPSWSWAAVNGPLEVDSYLYEEPAYQADWGEVRYEVSHWEKCYGPRLVNSHLLHNSDNP
ncbi:heterokaryon incompatibility protein-domain-containing protein [Hyaloscypha sp. PMI_1271]|nr:heterokaryon incompatibility protein-domain-containing protein [Hyaloscypha sp. PMI_1271]